MSRKRQQVDLDELTNRAERESANVEVDAAVFGDGNTAQNRTLRILRNNDIKFGVVTITPVGLEITDQMSFEDWQRFGTTIRRLQKTIAWIVGDWLAHGERHYRDTYETAAEKLGYKVKTLYNYKYVASRVELSLRCESLSFTHHYLVATLEPDRQAYWLAKAVEGKWSIKRLKIEMVKEGCDDVPTTPSKTGNHSNDVFKFTIGLKAMVKKNSQEWSGVERLQMAQILEEILAELRRGND